MRIVLVGTGRVAAILGEVFLAADEHLLAVLGRNELKTTQLAKRLGCQALDVDDMIPACDIVIIAVSDDAIRSVSDAIKVEDHQLVVHTSGTSEMNKLDRHEQRGVLWPIQSITAKTQDLNGVPFVIEGNTPQAEDTVRRIASLMSEQVVDLPIRKRKILHMAAVLMSNFPVHLMAEAGRKLEEQDLDPSLLLPLWNGMAARVSAQGHNASLTGPARRGDEGTVNEHLELLVEDNELRTIYETLSASILKKFHG